MNNILTYIEWRGDLTFSQGPFNEVDNLIFSLLSYVDWRGILPADDAKEITLEKAADILLSGDTPPYPDEPNAQTPETQRYMLHALAASRRYRGVKLSRYVDILDRSSSKQFTALCLRYGARRIYLSYRGTSDDLAGWKEDFLLACVPEIPSQEEALRYLKSAAEAWPDARIMVGGHSKGGNLAVYAAASADAALQERIDAVWSNDGPGFQRRFVESAGYQRIQPHIRSIVPKSSVVGMLLSHEENYRIVDSSQTGLLQHDGMSWAVLGGGFVTLPERTLQSVRSDRAISAWIDGLTAEERLTFVDALFEVLTASGAETLSEVKRDKLKVMTASLSRMRETPREIRERIVDFLLLLNRITVRLRQESRVDRAIKVIERRRAKNGLV